MNEWVNLGKKQAELFSNNHLPYIELLVTGNSNRNILNLVYRVLIRTKQLIPIESLSEQDKALCWQTAKEFSNDRLDTDKLVEMVKALYSLEYLLTL